MSKGQTALLRASVMIGLITVSFVVAFMLTRPPTAIESLVGGDRPSSQDEMWAKLLTAIFLLGLLVVVAMLLSSGLPEEVGMGPFTYKRPTQPEVIEKAIDLGDRAAGQSREIVKSLESQLDLGKQLVLLEEEVERLRQERKVDAARLRDLEEKLGGDGRLGDA